ncbi:DUF6894 family protein [Methylobacterium sp. JK268]
MRTYRFHCTNGLECVLDGSGQRLRPGESVAARARAVAADVARHGGDWSGWSVTVHDLAGRQVLVVPFGAGPALALAA